tara:strand:+ start:1333 stop:2853 length:1521 start_codon:yes stop_codon:yes gene_type:complete
MKYFQFIFLFLFYGLGYSQEISGIVIDSLNNESIPFAAITSNFDNNTITNEEGKFRIFKDGSFDKNDSLFISSIGFHSRSLPLSDNKFIRVLLSAKAIELNSVEVSNREKLSVDQILKKVKKNIINTYDLGYRSKKIFWRETGMAETKKIDFKIKNSSIAEFDQILMDSISSTIPRKTNFYKENLSEFYGNKDPDNQKITAVKSARLLNKENQISLELIQNKIQPIVELRIKPDSYFKFKSGIFPIDITLDGINLRAIDSSDTSRLEKIKKNELDDKKQFNNNNRKFIKSISDYYLKFDYEKERFDLEVFKKSRLYNFKLVELSYIGYDPIYVIDYTPSSSKAKYKGKLYIHADDFAVVRIDYNTTDVLYDFNLFGVSASVDYRFGKQIFKKNNNGKYDLYFSENTFQRSFGLDRPLKIVEKNKNVKGRRKQNELKMDIVFKGVAKIKTEVIFLNNIPIKSNDFEAYKESDSDLPFELTKYDPDFWNGYNIIEPSEVLKSFKIEKN